MANKNTFTACGITDLYIDPPLTNLSDMENFFSVEKDFTEKIQSFEQTSEKIIKKIDALLNKDNSGILVARIKLNLEKLFYNDNIPTYVKNLLKERLNRKWNILGATLKDFKLLGNISVAPTDTKIQLTELSSNKALRKSIVRICNQTIREYGRNSSVRQAAVEAVGCAVNFCINSCVPCGDSISSTYETTYNEFNGGTQKIADIQETLHSIDIKERVRKALEESERESCSEIYKDLNNNLKGLKDEIRVFFCNFLIHLLQLGICCLA